MATLMALCPVVFLIWSMTKPSPWPSHVALPLTALLTALIQLGYFEASLQLLTANGIAGVLSVLTPISIVAGAILLNRVLVHSGAEEVLRHWLERISTNQVAQLMIIGWAFAFMLEGASGFGTPAAIAAPILVGLGFAPMSVALLTLVMNSVPVSFGAVGTPTWFGFEALNLSDVMVLQISSYTGLMHLAAGLVIPVLALKFLVSWQAIRANFLFILISILSCTLPYFLLAQINYEFPALLGGALGLAISIAAAKAGVGLHREHQAPLSSTASLPFVAVLKALSPFILLIVILIVTRVQQLEIKALLNSTTPWFSLAGIEVSEALIISWRGILDTSVNWSYKTLYVPALIPFVVTVLLLVPILSLRWATLKLALGETGARIKLPVIALIGALMMVNFMMQGDERAPIFIIADGLARLMGESWVYVAALLGALGSFFSGSATVSNLTFGGIQYGIAEQTALPVALVLALQSVGAAMGNMVCINNIIAVATILGIKNQEGAMIKRTVIPMLVYAAIAALMGAILLHLA
ncbi:L-lactate permease [Marinomonas ostreistagni]|uniref:L-lactate permease n=1 Tax=Marinomonas ostreistagni TaxID=359209 RepID=UPI00194E7673|nr:L-lactate permease [Marinomonas ostreistagni]MBM6550972.1 L-lactate permease [Marinomonas ostreistagni]